MYPTGTAYDFMPRAHQFISGGPSYASDLSAFQTEGSGYINQVSGYTFNSFIREINHKRRQFESGFNSTNG